MTNDASAAKTVSPTDLITIDLWSDIVCPWCYIGESRLHDALRAEGLSDRFHIQVHPFELNPQAPDDDTSATNIDFLVQRKGLSRDQALQMEQQVADLAGELNRPFVLERPMANTRTIHRICEEINVAGGNGSDFFFHVERQYFSGELNPFDTDDIASTAVAYGLSETRAYGVIAGHDYAAKIDDERRIAQALGAQGVPFFLFAQSYSAPGALPMETFRQVVRSLAQQQDAGQTDE